jgi:hypothetical protein
MGQPSFALMTRWRLRGRIEDIAAILGEPERFPEWWSAVYLAAETLEPGDSGGLGRVVAVRTRGWLPYTLSWQARLVAADRPHRWTIEATGELTGTGTWRLEQRGADALATYDWRVRVEKSLLRSLTPFLAPLYAANHRWAMARGHEGLERELERRSGPRG